MIERIASVGGIPIAPAPPKVGEASPTAPGFGETLGRALKEVDALQVKAQAAASAIASGRDVDMTQTLVTIEKANISLQFALQIRNKLLEAYQEVMRIQV